MDQRALAQRQQQYQMRQRKKYTALLSEMGKSLQEYEVLQRQITELDEERNKLKEQLKSMLTKIGFIVGPDFVRALDGAY